MTGDIDYTINLPLAELWLAKADRTIVTKLNNRSGVGFSRFGKRTKFIKHTQLIKLNSTGELEFSIPFQIEVDHELVHNTDVDLINESSLIKCIFNGDEEWFVVVDIKKTMDDSKDILDLSCRSLNYELTRRYVRNFKVVSANLSSLLLGGTTINSNGDSVAFSGLLQGTLWGLSVDTDTTFNTVYRSIDISKSTVLDGIITIAKTFNAIMTFDSVNRKIRFQQMQNVGLDMGGRITFENYMRSLENENKTDLLVTRLIPWGKNNLSINGVSPNGQNFIDDFSYWMVGFSMDSHGNVLSSSPHMSDSLCIAITNYIKLLASNSTNFSSLLTTLAGYQTTLTTKQNELAALNTTLVSLQQQLVVAQTSGTSTVSLLAQITSQNALISTKQSEINTVNANIASTNTSITALQTLLSTNSNFTTSQQTELIPFIREGEFSDNNITDPQDLYNQALVQFSKLKTPQITLKVDMVNIWEDIESQFVWDKFKVGNDILVEYDVLGTSIKSKIIELSFDHAAGNVQITIASVADIIRQEEAVFNMLYQNVSAANTLSVNVDNWNGIDTVAANVNALYNSNILGSKIAINAGVSNNITINSLGLTSIVASSPNNIVRLSNGNLGFSVDGGNSYATAINAQGVNAAVIVGQLLLGANLNIANQSGSVTIDGNGMTVTSMNLTLTRSDNNSRILLDSTNGIKIQAKSGGVFVDKFYADSSGNIFANSITLSTPQINNGAIVGTSISVNGNFTVNSAGIMSCTGANISGNINMTSGSISWGSVSAPSPSQVGALATNSPMLTHIDGSGIYTGTLNANQINVGTLTGFTIQTAASGGRLVLSGNTLQSLNGSSQEGVQIYPSFGGTGGYLGIYYAGTTKGSIFGDSSQLNITANSPGTNLLIQNNNGYIRLQSSSIVLGGTLTAGDIYSAGNIYINNNPVATQLWVQSNSTAKFA